MTSHSYFETACDCGRIGRHQAQGTTFTCACGRQSLIDFSMGYSERDLVEMLNRLDVQRDQLARTIEIRRDRKTA
jgi:1,4-dihydroxy-2-naphthoyl-CoA synthase